MSTMPGGIFLISELSDSHPSRLYLLVSQSRHGGDGDSAGEIVGGKLRSLQTRVLQRVIDAFKDRNQGSGRGTPGGVWVRTGTRNGRRGRGSIGRVSFARRADALGCTPRARLRRIHYDDAGSMTKSICVSVRAWPGHPGYEVRRWDYLMV
jgi:hypothetical protein